MGTVGTLSPYVIHMVYILIVSPLFMTFIAFVASTAGADLGFIFSCLGSLCDVTTNQKPLAEQRCDTL